jgi:hypothetical protein
MTALQRLFAYLASALLAGCLASGCKVEVDPQAVTVEGNNVDWTTYRGLSIKAHRWVPGLNGEEHSYGAQDLLELQNAIYSQCYDEVAVQRAEAYQYVCDDVNIGDDEVYAPVLCGYTLCTQQLSLCAGYRLLALADAVDAVSFQVDPLLRGAAEFASGVDPSTGRLLGVVSFKYFYTGDPYQGNPDMALSGSYIRYKIPPQAPADRTLLYEAAMGHFRRAGILSGRALQADCLNPALGALSWSEDPELSPDRRTLGLSGFNEAAIRFEDAVEGLTRNELEVASVGGALERGERQERVWNGEVNSRASVLRRLRGDFDTEAGANRLPVGTQPLDDAVRKAITLTRASGIALDDPSIDSANVATIVTNAVLDLTDPTMVADGGLEPPPDSGVDGSGELSRISVDEFLESNHLLPEDFAAARRYLLEERVLLARPAATDAGTADGGAPVSFAFSAAPENPPAAQRTVMHSQSYDRVDPEVPDAAQAMTGAEQAMGYFRDVARSALQLYPSLAAGHLRLLQNVTDFAEPLIGSGSIREKYGVCASGYCGLEIAALRRKSGR